MITKIILITIMTLATTLFFNSTHETTKTRVDHQDTLEDNVIFEGVGKYAFATAGSNNADRGETTGSGYKWIVAPPDSTRINYDWATVEAQILAETGLTTITNITGSYLNLEGTLKSATLSFLASQNTSLTGYTGRILIINPDGSYSIINYQENNIYLFLYIKNVNHKPHL